MLKSKYCKTASGCKGAGEWIRDEEQFQNWISDQPTNRVLWVYGEHGVGKSVLCALTIEHMTKIYGELSVIYVFIHKTKRVTTNQLLLQLANQLLNSIPSDITEVPECLKGFLQLNKFDTTMITGLICSLLLFRSSRCNGAPTYIFVDGLDEREYFDASIEEESTQTENRSFIQTLVDISTIPSASIRLWFSSQPIGIITECFKELGTPSIEITTEKTMSDVLEYLKSAIPKSIDSGSVDVKVDYWVTVIKKMLNSDTTFLWAYSTYKDLEQVRDEDSVRKVLKSVPTTVNEQYELTMTKIQRKPREGANIRKSELPIWKIVLSMLVFAYRPLRLFELMEGVAILRTKDSENIENRPHPRDILDACMSLTILLPDEDTAISSIEDEAMESSIVMLCHGTVRKFLKERSDLTRGQNKNSSSEEFVSSKIMGECCIRYFLQARFRILLEKVGKDGALLTGGVPREHINANSLIFYAAKYWHRHFDTGIVVTEQQGNLEPQMPTQEDINIVIRFLESPNFVTCVQVQSLCVEGHFLQSYDTITDRATKRRRVLPNWFLRCRKDLYCQFEEFISEWGELLQSGSSEHANGELDRCLWQALGDGNFLSKRNSRASPELLVNIWDITDLNTPCFKTPTTLERRNSWKSSYKMPQRHIPIKIDPKTENIDHYGGCISRNFPIIPSLRCVVPPDVIAVFHDKGESLVRIGSSFFRISASEGTAGSSKASKANSYPLVGPWEDLRFQGRYLVASRRRGAARDPSSQNSSCSNSLFDSDSGIEGTDCTSSGDETWDDDASTDFSASERTFDSESRGVCAADDESDNFSDIDHCQEDSTDSDISYAGSETGDLNSGFESDFDCEDSRQLYADLNLESLESDEDEGWENPCSERLDAKAGNLPRCTNSTPQPHKRLSFRDNIPNEALATFPDNIQRIVIAEPHQECFCMIEGCDEKILQCWYYCPTCSSEGCSYRICYECEKAGHWCLNIGHQLYNMFNGKAVGVIAKNQFTPRNRLDVFDTTGPQLKRVFSFQQKPKTMLYESPPAIHPKYPLVVWALCGREMLFVDIQSNARRRHCIETPDIKGVPICSNLSFSRCGAFLRVANIGVIVKDTPLLKTTDHMSENARTAFGVKPRLCLILRVVVMKLFEEKPLRQPKKVMDVSVNLGCCEKPLIKQLPFTFTWSDEQLYVAVSSSRLRVYRVDLSNNTDTNVPPVGQASQSEVPDKSYLVKTLKEVIFLPRSARNRRVQFRPLDQPEKLSMVIIGPRPHQKDAESIALYLSDLDLGGWVTLKERELAEAELFSCHFKDMHEDFDAAEDCDIVPMAHDKW
ncbi:hypothetical protein TWF730_000342 [Orbilia blumenaviensis]|uniref:Nephrocystin 3-like N-terminal domain-containing protein n=1 Tax=Orbilia blumenaviensis TaxID=1796055 RepID=A0AAV9VL89_9PEZI